MAFDAGTALGKYILDISDAEQKAAQLKALFSGIQQQAAQASKAGGGGSAASAAADQQKAERAILARAAAEARLAQVQNTGKNALTGLTQAEQIYQQALAKVDQSSLAAIRTQTQLAAVQNRIANQAGGGLPVLPRTVESFGTQAIDQVKSGLLGIVGPAAVATAGMAAFGKAIDLTEESFKLKAALDTTNLSIQLQLKNFRDVNVTLQEGRQFAERYKITQEENADAIQASIPLLRQSHASLSDVEGVLSRLAVLKPEQGIRGAAFALGELEGGQARSLATRFNIPIAKATELKNAIKNGGDAVAVMNDYLNSVGLGMETLDVRTQGATGKMNELKVETEKFKLALGGAAGGPGLEILETRIRSTTALTRLLSGDFQGLREGAQSSIQGITGSFANANPIANAFAQIVDRVTGASAGLAAQQARNSESNNRLKDDTVTLTAAVALSSTALDEEAQKKIADKIETAELAQQQAQLDRDSRAAAVGLLGAGNQALILAQKYGIATEQAQFLINQQQALSNATALADQRKGEQTGTNLSAKQFNEFNNLRRDRDKEIAADKKKSDDKAVADAARLNDLQNQNRLINARTSAEKIRLLQREKAAETDPIKRQELQNQIDQERISAEKAGGRKRIDAAASTALQLNNVEENSQLQLARTQREGLERLRDQQDDFDLRRVRSQEDEDRKIRRLLAGGQIAAAKREREEFAIEQRRAREDFDRERRRTLRNNQEGLGDIGARTDLRQTQIGNRAALRNGGATLGSIPPPTAETGLAGAGGIAGARVIQVTLPTSLVTPDGQVIANITYPFIAQRIDDDLSIELRGAALPGASQDAVSGSRP